MYRPLLINGQSKLKNFKATEKKTIINQSNSIQYFMTIFFTTIYQMKLKKCSVYVINLQYYVNINIDFIK